MKGQADERAQVLHIARLTLEALSPISLGSGDSSSLGDVLVFRDANGLPAIPGASLQGGLRHLWAETHGQRDPRERALFGTEERDGRGQAGRLIFGFGAVHGADNTAVVGLVAPRPRPAEDADPVLEFLAGHTPVLRHHVKLDDRHVADDRAKFDRAAAPAGTRFSFEIAMWGDLDAASADKALLVEVLKLLCHPAYRLGGAGRRGYGRVRILLASYACADPRVPGALREIRKQPSSTGLAEMLDLSPEAAFGAAVARLRLQPLGPWRIGTTYEHETEPPAVTKHTVGIRFADPQREPYRVGTDQRNADEIEKAPDILILREPRIVWEPRDGAEVGLVNKPLAGTGSFQFVVPGSALRGPLVHRMLFHWNKALGHCIDAEAWIQKDNDGRDAIEADCRTLREQRPKHWADLLGLAKERVRNAGREDRTTDGRASRLFVNDGIAKGTVAVQALTHNVIDRFTGGVINKLFYSEEFVIGGEIAIDLAILPAPGGNRWDDDVANALVAALRDLCEGRLALGAKSLGFCTGDLSWSGGSDQWTAKWGGGPISAAMGSAG